MLEILKDSGLWLVTGGLLLAGLIGCIIPVLPGHLIIIVGAVAYKLMAGAEGNVSWWSVGILVALAVISQLLEIVSGSLGAKWFGGSRWGAIGAVVGAIVGLFFFPIGLLLGPLLGAFGFEYFFAKKKTRDSAVSGVGSVVGTLTGMVFKIVIGVAMISWFLIDALVLRSA